jgi:hypothetical protein
MRARELLQENYNESLASDLNNLLVGAKGNGAQQVRTQNVVGELYKMGYSIDVNSILPLLTNNPLVTNATPEMIVLTAPEGAENAGAGQDSASQVSDMAQSATKIG